MFMCSLTSKCKGFRSVSARSPLQDRRTIAVVAAFLGACAYYAACCDSTSLNLVNCRHEFGHRRNIPCRSQPVKCAVGGSPNRTPRDATCTPEVRDTSSKCNCFRRPPFLEKRPYPPEARWDQRHDDKHRRSIGRAPRERVVAPRGRGLVGGQDRHGRGQLKSGGERLLDSSQNIATSLGRRRENDVAAVEHCAHITESETFKQSPKVCHR